MIKVTSYLCNNNGNVLGTEGISTDRGYTYLHGRLEDDYCDIGGYDIPCFLTDNFPTEPGVYPAMAVFPDNVEVPATFFYWHAAISGGTTFKKGLIVANDDTPAFKHAENKYKEKSFHV